MGHRVRVVDVRVHVPAMRRLQLDDIGPHLTAGREGGARYNTVTVMFDVQQVVYSNSLYKTDWCEA